VKATTLTQPWAELVAGGFKQWETRSWSTNYRGPLAIHAAKGFPPAAKEFAEAERALGRVPSRLALGAIVAVATVVDVRHTEEVTLEISGLERHLGDYSPGRYAWQLDNVRRLAEPIAARGALGLWTPSADALLQLEAAS
jgi:activating signal cointegrator 1